MPTRPPETRPLLRKIYDALAQHPTANGVRISIESEPGEIRRKDGTTLRAKSLCWNLLAAGEEVTAPVLAVVHECLTEDLLRSDLALFFEGYHCVVDNDIHITDD